MGAEYAFNHRAHPSADALLYNPVNCGIFGVQFQCDLPQGLIAQNLYRAVVYFQRVIGS